MHPIPVTRSMLMSGLRWRGSSVGFYFFLQLFHLLLQTFHLLDHLADLISEVHLFFLRINSVLHRATKLELMLDRRAYPIPYRKRVKRALFPYAKLGRKGKRSSGHHGDASIHLFLSDTRKAYAKTGGSGYRAWGHTSFLV